MYTIKVHHTQNEAIQDADNRPMKQIWKSLTGLFAVGDQEDLPNHPKWWREISRAELEG